MEKNQINICSDFTYWAKFLVLFAQSAGAVEYTDYTSAEG